MNGNNAHGLYICKFFTLIIIKEFKRLKEFPIERQANDAKSRREPLPNQAWGKTLQI
jgi:hypothetical protein